MTRIRGKSLDEIKFQANDTPPTRAQKLELIRLALLALDEDVAPLTSVAEGGALDAYRIPGYFVQTPAANATLHLHTLTDDVFFFPDFAGSEADIGILPGTPFVATIYRNPTMTGLTITGGEIIGTLTYAVDGTATWATTDQKTIQLLDGDVVGVRGPAVADLTAAQASFTLYAVRDYVEQLLKLSGDQTDGDDLVKLSGDQSDGDDVVALAGNERFARWEDEPYKADARSTGYIQGSAGPPGPPGPEIATYLHTQSSAATEWIVNHNKGAYPALDVLSPGLIVVEAEVEHFTVNQVRVRFATAQTGYVLVR